MLIYEQIYKTKKYIMQLPQITFSFSEIALVILILTPFLMKGWAEWMGSLILRFSSRDHVEKVSNAHHAMINELSAFSRLKYYSLMIAFPILEEVVFRYLPLYFAFKMGFDARSIIIAGVTSSLLFGILHYPNHKSVSLALFIQGAMGVLLFAAFVMFTLTWGWAIGLCVICFVHLFYNLILSSAIFPQKSYERWEIEHYYRVKIGRNLDKEFDQEIEKYLAEQDVIDKGLEKENLSTTFSGLRKSRPWSDLLKISN